jgi:hypothetical protein
MVLRSLLTIRLLIVNHMDEHCSQFVRLLIAIIIPTRHIAK